MPEATPEPPKDVLVISDSAAILELFTALLEDEGYQVSIDTFSIEMLPMLERVRELSPNAIVLDFAIGDEGNGWQFLQVLHMDRTTASIPVVACTAAVKLVEELQAHLDMMGVRVVIKPFDIDHLVSELRRALESADEARPGEGG